ncbi:MAG: hypothetical protein QGF09_12455, partial [Rhodospirillales bacterium]|nr:hypothetical protein [Rhodospirillales bacterium]
MSTLKKMAKPHSGQTLSGEVSSADRAPRRAALESVLEERILILDGAAGTMIQDYKLDEAGFRGEQFADHNLPQNGNNDLLNLTQPGIIWE